MAELTEVQEAVLQDRFYHPGESSWYDVCERVARTWGDTPEHVGAVYEMMRSRRALPNTPAIANAGRTGAMGSACYVLPINDSLTDGPASIMQTLKDAAAVHKSGGGTGFSFGRIRGRGSPVSSTGRPAPGAVNVLELYSDAIARVTQAGMRPGANMGILPVDHPDILEFIGCKGTEGKITNFNISVAVTDDFMNTVTHMDYWEWEAGRDHWRSEREIWGAIVDGAWRNGEPGVIFIDTINNASLHPELIEATNPCGEVPLRPYEACVLGSINLVEHLSPCGCGIDYAALSGTIRTLVRLLDNIIEDQTYPIPEIEREQKYYRKIGVGVMGWADLLIKMKIRYGSEESLKLADFLMHYIQDRAYNESWRLAEEKGPYPGHGDHEGLPYRRNLTCLSQAPTGTISRLAGTSFGIEPNFDREYDSFIIGSVFHEVHPFADSPYFVAARDVSPEEHLLTQAAFQKHIDLAVSKTLNLPATATRADIEKIYFRAWELNLKGVTILREASRTDNVLASDPNCKDGVCAL